MTRYWIIVASKDHAQKGVAEGFAQACHGKATPLKRMKKGDFVIYYSSKLTFGKSEPCQKFTAIGKVADNEVYPFQMTETFCPYRRNIKFFKSKEVSIFQLIDLLDFIPNKKSWGYPFRYGFLEINENDFNLIASKMLENE
ncbi:EVE domain-containing protein [Capnocytophaga sp.]|uniref:EVE domain-containing protein n=1 Tax=Capnocytophaga sp. TaxID=44737 RepID=UPI0026DB0C6F|nr:EVE domain-containing protein [Capnocytophaga sp.]MDO5106141.1 EVE domain-containing protein [Capnocytophaga sp.]